MPWKGKRFAETYRKVAPFAFLVPILLLLWLSNYAYAPGPETGKPEVTVIIPAHSGFSAIEQKLAEAGVIRPDHRFRLLAKLLGVSKSLRPGEYLFSNRATPYQVLRQLHRGSLVKHPLTIPEGSNLAQIGAILSNGGWTSETEFRATITDPKFLAELGIKYPSLEGYLFPDTYFLERGAFNLRTLLTVMVGQTRKVLVSTGAAAGLPDYGLDAHQVLTLASIVEKETGLASERPLIARVFLNRLRDGMKLQTDPTVIYGIKDFNGNLTRLDLQTHTPYNTYLITGLPPGPIANPGRAAIQAVMAPTAGDYYYFVSKNDGSHYFSKTLLEHNRAVSQFQKGRQSNKPKK
ncbi:MAG TPA: endolytic transglycosylase MltG [Desulfurivibrionaceae bacterium]|nr:endolytic transglycosylase MltG [Desulfurivibrionaceae bacterium]